MKTLPLGKQMIRWMMMIFSRHSENLDKKQFVYFKTHVAEGRSLQRSPPLQFKLEIKKFKCFRALSEVVKDEIYWCSASSSDLVENKQYFQSGIWSRVTSGDTMYYSHSKNADRFVCGEEMDKAFTFEV